MAASEKVVKKQLDSMAKRILEEGKKIGAEPLVVEYDNGGGQSGVRENPFYSAYEKLLAAYLKALAAYIDMAGNDTAKIQSLDEIRARFKVAK